MAVVEPVIRVTSVSVRARDRLARIGSFRRNDLRRIARAERLGGAGLCQVVLG